MLGLSTKISAGYRNILLLNMQINFLFEVSEKWSVTKNFVRYKISTWKHRSKWAATKIGDLQPLILLKVEVSLDYINNSKWPIYIRIRSFYTEKVRYRWVDPVTGLLTRVTLLPLLKPFYNSDTPDTTDTFSTTDTLVSTSLYSSLILKDGWPCISFWLWQL